MAAKRKRHAPEFKAQTALEASTTPGGSRGLRQDKTRGCPGSADSTTVPGDRSAQDGAGLVEKKIWQCPLTRSGDALNRATRN